MKKLLSLLLVMIMIVALAVPAYAADDEIIINFPASGSAPTRRLPT